QQGAVWPSANGEAPIVVRVPSIPSVKAETVPALAPLCALETKSCTGLVGRNSLPNGPRPWAVNGEPGAAVSRPSPPTVKLSISELATRVPTSLLPSALKNTSPGWEPSGSVTVETVSVPSAWRSKPAIVFTPPVLSFTYTCPTTPDVADAAPASTAPAVASASRTAKRRFVIPNLLPRVGADSPDPTHVAD